MEIAATMRALLDPDRLAVAGALAGRALDTDGLVAATGCERRVVLSALGELRSTGLVVYVDGRYELDRDALQHTAQMAADLDVPMDPVIGFGMTDDEQQILARYFSGRLLAEIPAHRAKRLIVLQRLALEFDVGRRYPEPSVDEILGAFHPDRASLRRGLVDEGLLSRGQIGGTTQYWRTGGRTAGLPPPAAPVQT